MNMQVDAADGILIIHLYEPEASFYHVVPVQNEKILSREIDWSWHFGS